jgi:hypothetical protein
MLIAKQVSGKSTSNKTTTIGLENKIQHFVSHETTYFGVVIV